MFFNYKEEKYRLDFLYAITNSNLRGVGVLADLTFGAPLLTNSRIITFALLKKQNPQNAKEYIDVAGDYSVTHPIDHFNKIDGRRHALSRMIDQVGDKELKKMIWPEYTKMAKTNFTVKRK